MPTQWPHQVSSQEFQNPDSPPTYAHANTRNEPKKTSPAPGGPPVFNPHGSGGYANSQKIRNEPNSPYRASLAAPAHPRKMQNEPNLPRRQLATLAEGQSRSIGEPNSPNAHHPPPKKIETNPIHPAASQPRWPKVSQSLSRRAGDLSGNPTLAPPQKIETNPIYRRDPQSTNYFYETNPISVNRKKAISLYTAKTYSENLSPYGRCRTLKMKSIARISTFTAVTYNPTRENLSP